MASYYASKSYVFNLTMAIHEELRRENSNVYVGVLCPGPVDTEFNKVAGVKFSVKSLVADKVCNYAINKMFNKKMLIIPGFQMKFIYAFSSFLPLKMKLKLTYNIQKSKKDNTK